MSCTDNRCTDITHRYELDILYTDICSALYEAGLASIPSSDCNSSNQHVVPGWNEYVRDSHTEARHAYVTWRDFGKPRQGPVHELMRSTRLRFKYALRQCQSRQETARADALARNLSSKDMTSFWKSIKTINNKRIPLASTINGVTGEHDISELWKCVIASNTVFYWAINRPIVLPGQMTDDTWSCGYMLVVSVENTDILFNLLHS